MEMVATMRTDKSCIGLPNDIPSVLYIRISRGNILSDFLINQFHIYGYEIVFSSIFFFFQTDKPFMRFNKTI